MPLPPPTAPRAPLHRRQITLDGYRREDGLWDIEARLVDTKAYAFENAWRGTLTPGMALHDMSLRLTLDETYTVRDVAVSHDATPFPECPAILPNFQKLIGERIAKGWNQKVRDMLGGVAGCTHLVELLGPIGTVAFQTIAHDRYRDRSGQGAPPQPPKGRRPPILDTCHALASDSSVVERSYPDFYTGPKAAPTP